MTNKILFIADFSNTGGTFTYFKTLTLHLLQKENTNLVVLIKKHQLTDNTQEFLNKHRIKHSCYYEPIVSLNKYLGTRINNYLNRIINYLYFLIKTMQYRPSLIIQSTGSQILFNLFLIPSKILIIQHSLMLYDLDKINRTIINNFLCKKKQIITVSNHALICLKNSFRIKVKKEPFCSFILNSHEPIKTINKTKNTKFQITTIGHVDYHKNPAFWVKLATHLTTKNKNIYFTWVGDGRQLSKYQTKTCKNKQVSFIGHRNNLGDIYNETDIYLQPSISESHGISILGAMAARVPCVVANVGGMPESVVHNETGFVYESDNLTEATAYIEQLINNALLRQQFGAKGYDRYKQLFTPEIWEHNMSTFLKENFNV